MEQIARYEFLRKQNFELYALCRDADHYADIDSIIALTKARLALEVVVRLCLEACHCHSQRNLFQDIKALTATGKVDQATCNQMQELRRRTNKAVHEDAGSPRSTFFCLNMLFDIVSWYQVYFGSKQ
jgi:hypothetical protein